MRRTCFIFLSMFLLLAFVTLKYNTISELIAATNILDLEMDEIFGGEISDENYWTMVDSAGKEIMVTGRRIWIGDEYITSENKLYHVYKTDDRKAYAHFVREVWAVYQEENKGLPVMLRDIIPAQAGDNLAPEDEPQELIGIYHTHNAESYVPTDGTESIYGRGGIHQVGASFKESMEEKGIRVIHDETLHLPHDRGAYRRSRPTAQRLLAEGPDVIFDIHRDAAPRHAYATQVNDEWVTQIEFVVGRQNVNMPVNRQFALDLKSYADQIHPGLVRGIFMAHGNYNQDLSPLKLLLEVGAHTNSRSAAEDGISLFADVVSFYFYGPEEERRVPAPVPAPGTAPSTDISRANRIALGSTFTILFLTSLIIIGFFLLNARRWQDLKIYLDPWIKKIRFRLQKGDLILEPWKNGIYKFFGPVRSTLKPPLASLARGFNRVWLLLVPYLEQGDTVLEPWKEAIHDNIFPRLMEIDRYLSSTQERLNLSLHSFYKKIVPWLNSAEERLELWSDRIREFALIAKKRFKEILENISNRRKLR